MPALLRVSAAWQLGGQVAYIAGQGLVLVVLARLGDAVIVGQYSLALALAAPVYLLLNASLRQLLATDPCRSYHTSAYLTLRCMATVLSFAATMGLGAALYGRESELLITLFWVSSYKAVESIADLTYGVFERSTLAHRVGTSLALRGLLAGPVSAAGFAAAGLSGAVGGLFIGTLAVFVLHDIPNLFEAVRIRKNEGTRLLRTLCPSDRKEQMVQVRNLARQAWPLGLAGGLYALNASLPRYAIDHYLGAADLGLFAAAAYIMTALGAMVDAVVRAIAPRLASLSASSDTKAASVLVRRSMLLTGLGGMLVIGLMAAGIGDKVMRIVFGAAYAPGTAVLTGLAVATAGVLLSAILGAILLVERAIRSKACAAAFGVLVQVVFIVMLVPRYGLMGAVYAYGVSIGARVAAEGLMVYVRKSRKRIERAMA